MPFEVVEKNRMLDSTPITHVSLHIAMPDSAGSDEVTGGNPAYARKAGTWAAAAGGSRSSTAAVQFDVPAVTVKWQGFWDAVTAGTFRGSAPLGGSPFSYYVDVTGNLLRAANHGLANDNLVVFFNGTPPAPLAAGTEYFVVGQTAETFQVSASMGGAAIVLTDPGTAECRCSLIVPEIYASQGTHSVSSYPMDVNF